MKPDFRNYIQCAFICFFFIITTDNCSLHGTSLVHQWLPVPADVEFTTTQSLVAVHSMFWVMGTHMTQTHPHIYIYVYIYIYLCCMLCIIYIYSIHRSRYTQLCDILNMLTWFVYLPFTGAIAHKCWTPGSKIPGVGREPTSGCGCRNILAAKTRGFPLLKTRLRMGIQHGDSGEILHEFAVGESLFFFCHVWWSEGNWVSPPQDMLQLN